MLAAKCLGIASPAALVALNRLEDYVDAETRMVQAIGKRQTPTATTGRALSLK